MISDKLQEAKTSLYIYDGALPPSDYRGLSNGANAVVMDDAAIDKQSFWERHLQKAVNKNSTKFDWTFGVILPVTCFAADPIVFKSAFRPQDAYLADFRPFAYLLSFMSIMAMLAWLIWGERLKGLAVFVSGILAAGAVASLLIALLLFPLSMFGLVIVIGILGFTPFFTFAAFWRNSRRAFVAARPYFTDGMLTRTVGLIALVTLTIPMIANAAMAKNMVARVIEIITR